MRFHRSDLPGFLIAVAAPPLLMLLFLASFETWDHHGTPLLGAVAGNVAGAAGTAAVFSRFVRKWDVPLLLLGVMLAMVAGVNWAQASDNDGTALATTMKLIGVGAFGLLNVVVLWQVLQHGLLPILQRRDAPAE